MLCTDELLGYWNSVCLKMDILQKEKALYFNTDEQFCILRRGAVWIEVLCFYPCVQFGSSVFLYSCSVWKFCVSIQLFSLEVLCFYTAVQFGSSVFLYSCSVWIALCLY